MPACHVVTSMAPRFAYTGNWLNHIKQDSPTNLWLMDEGAGNTMVDFTGNQNGSIVSGATRTDAGELGGTFGYTQVSNLNGVASAPTAVRPTAGQKFSIEFSVYGTYFLNGLYSVPINTLPSGNPALGSGVIIYATGGNLTFGIYQDGSNYRGGTCLSDTTGGMWHHYVFTFDGVSTWKVYHNGTPVAVTPTTAGTITAMNYAPNAPMMIGGNSGAPVGSGNKMDFMAYWAGVELNQTQVTAHFVSS